MNRRILGGALGAILIVMLAGRSLQSALAQATATPTLVHPAGASWQGYILLEFAAVGPFINGASDELKAKLHSAFLMLAREHDNWPPYVLQDSRWRLDNRAVIIEARFISMPTKAQAGQLIANRTSYTLAQINAAVAVTVFALGGTWEQSRDECAAYLAAHRPEWEPVLP